MLYLWQGWLTMQQLEHWQQQQSWGQQTVHRTAQPLSMLAVRWPLMMRWPVWPLLQTMAKVQ